MPFAADIDLKDLQYQVVAYRKKAVQLITEINYAKSRNSVKEIKAIENEPINPKISYQSLNVEKLRSIPIPDVPQVSPNNTNCAE